MATVGGIVILVAIPIVVMPQQKLPKLCQKEIFIPVEIIIITKLMCQLIHVAIKHGDFREVFKMGIFVLIVDKKKIIYDIQKKKF